MSKQALVRREAFQPILLGCYTLTATGLEVEGRPTMAEHEAVGEFIRRAQYASGFWLADWLRYGESRREWAARLEQAIDHTGYSLKTLKNVRAVGAIDKGIRRDDVEFGIHEAVAGLAPAQQTKWLARAAEHGWGVRELRLAIRASRRTRVIDGQALLAGMYRVIYADPPWLYGNRPPSASGASDHYPAMTIDEICTLPVKAHALPSSVLFLWVTAPMLYEAPGPREVITAWGFTPKTGRVWHKTGGHGFGSYFSTNHEHLILATRGDASTPDRPVPMLDSVVVERQEGPHSSKPESFRKDIERLYDGPYLELFGRQRVDGWDVFGNDARLWAQEAIA